MLKVVSDYLDKVCDKITPLKRQKAVRAELAGHFAEAISASMAAGLSEDEAAQRACEQMGEASMIEQRLRAANNSSREKKVIICGFTLVFLTFVLAVFFIGANSGVTVYRWYIDFPSLITVLGLGIGLALIGGTESLTKEKFFARTTITFLYAGGIMTLMGFMSILVFLTDLSALGPNIAVSLMSLLYALIFSGLSYSGRIYARSQKSRQSYSLDTREQLKG